MIAIPGVISMIASSLWGLSDGIFVGNLMGEAAFAAHLLALDDYYYRRDIPFRRTMAYAVHGSRERAGRFGDTVYTGICDSLAFYNDGLCC